MTYQILLYVGALSVILWGIAHLFPTRNVVAGFGTISVDNQRIITMEWVTEGIALIFIGVLVLAVTLADPMSTASAVTYVAASAALVALASLSLLTGFKVNFLPFKLCPFIFTLSAVLILLGGVVLP
jgi:hypothetical protein